MPTIASVTVRFSRKYQIRKDDWVGLEAVITLAVSEAEAAQTDPHSVAAEAFAIAKDSVIEQRAELRRELQAAQARAAQQAMPPSSLQEAEQRFFARYSAISAARIGSPYSATCAPAPPSPPRLANGTPPPKPCASRLARLSPRTTTLRSPSAYPASAAATPRRWTSKTLRTLWRP